MAMIARLPAIGELNTMPKQEFIAAMAPLFEGAPHFAPRRRLDETAAARKPVLRWRPAPLKEAAE